MVFVVGICNGFIVFNFFSSAEYQQLPFDLLEVKEELAANYQIKYSGTKFSLFYFASYQNLLVSSLFITWEVESFNSIYISS